MARELRSWVAATLVACGVIGFAYVPPRGSTPQPRVRPQVPEPSAARRRAQGLAVQWRAAERSARLAAYRWQVESEVAAHRVAGRSGPVLHIGEGNDLAPASVRLLKAALDTVWRQLGLGVSKVTIAVVLDWSGNLESPGGPTASQLGPMYSLPDSTDRATCLVLVPAGSWTRRLLVTQTAGDFDIDWFRFRLGWLRNALGPCAFYAAYGTPGKPVQRWLAARNYDLGFYPAWGDPEPDRRLGWPLVSPRTGAWFWDAVYQLPPDAAACLAGRADACQAAVLAGADGRDLDESRELATEPRWWRRERLAQAHRYLADVAQEVGRERFVHFWNSSAPVDRALATALKTPVGEWTERWQRRFAARLRVGPSAPPSATILGALVAAVAITLVAFYATRREVRP